MGYPRPRPGSNSSRTSCGSRALWVAAALAALVAIDGISWVASPAASASTPVPRPAQAARTEEVTFPGQDGTLSGTLFFPAGRGPHPAIVLLQGSGTEGILSEMTPSHPFWLDIAGFFLDKGFAVLAFDKAGTGRSAGDWRRQDFTDRARDALAAVDSLRRRPDIDGGRIGLAGHSQGGYIAQRAAALDPSAVAFVISLAGPAVGVREQILDDVSSNWRCRGNPPWLVTARRLGMNAALAAYGLVSRIAPIGYLGRIIRYDPARDIRSLSQPVLAIFAENDRLVHAAKNAERMEALLRDSPSPAWFVRQVPAADHFFRPSGFCDEPGDRWEWAPGFWEALDTEDFWRAVAGGQP